MIIKGQRKKEREANANGKKQAKKYGQKVDRKKRELNLLL